MIVESFRYDGKAMKLCMEYGYPTTKKPNPIPNKEKKQGARITFKPSLDVLGDINLNWTVLYDLVKHIISITPIGSIAEFTAIDMDGKKHYEKIINNEEAKIVYDNVMSVISYGLQYLENLGIPREDSAMLLPLGMETTEVDKRNLRNAIDMSRQRTCRRAYWEYRDLFKEYCKVLSDYSDEWKYIVDNYMMPKVLIT